MRVTLIAVDLSHESRPMLDWVLDLPHGADDRVSLLHVVDVGRQVRATLAEDEYLEEVRTRALALARQGLSDLRASHPEAGPILVESQVRWGDTASTILETARAEGATHIVVGRHGPENHEQGTLGSTAEKVLRGATCVVSVIPMKPTG